MALIPVAELLKRKSYSVVPGISISSKGTVDSVILLSKDDISKVGKVSVDKRSQSSTALLRIILEKFYNLSPVYESRKYEPKEDLDGEFLKDVDGGMLIGDAGLKYMYNPPRGYRVYDLGDIWTEHTGLSFVYAVFAVNEGVELDRNLHALERSGYVQKVACRRLGISRRKLNYMIRRMGITHPSWRRNRGPSDPDSVKIEQ